MAFDDIFNLPETEESDKTYLRNCENCGNATIIQHKFLIICKMKNISVDKYFYCNQWFDRVSLDKV
jgi:hypothetical protein